MQKRKPGSGIIRQWFGILSHFPFHRLTECRNGSISDFDNEMPKTTEREGQNRHDQDLYGGLIRLHILHHASKGPVFGLWFIEELARHGYKLSPGTLYPLLHGLEWKGYLRSTNERSGKSSRRMYRATPLGRKVLVAAREKVSELFGELLEE
jgi:PadR family transcriptional regulator, regulatory protein PadR